MSESNNLSELEVFFTALADKTRLRLLNLIRNEEVCVCFFVEALNESQPKISRHLAYLRKSGLVRARRDGKWMHYQIIEPENPYMVRILDNTLEALANEEDLENEHEKLVEACCAVQPPTTISRAPKPKALVEQGNIVESEELETHLL